MSSEGIKGVLIVALGNLTPSSIISEGWEEVFHVFFSKGTQDEVDQLLPPDRHSRSPQDRSQTFSDLSASSQLFTPAVSRLQNEAVLENIGQANSIFHQNKSGTSGFIMSPSKGPQQHTCITPSQRAPNNARISRIYSNTDDIPETHNHTNTVSRHMDKSANTEIFVAYTPDEMLRERAKMCPRAWKAIQGMKTSMLYKPDLYRNVWAGRAKLQFNAIDPIDRYATLQRILADNEMNASTTRYKQRITLLLGSHELEAIEKSLTGDERPRHLTSRTLAMNKLACCLKKDKKSIIYENRKRRHYVHVYKKVGPGALLLLGEGNDSLNLWENTLRDNEVDLALQYAERFLPEWSANCKKLQFEAARLMIEGLLTCGWDRKSYYDTEFMKRLSEFIDFDVFRNDERLQPVDWFADTSTQEPILANMNPPAKKRRIYCTPSIPVPLSASCSTGCTSELSGPGDIETFTPRLNSAPMSTARRDDSSSQPPDGNENLSLNDVLAASPTHRELCVSRNSGYINTGNTQLPPEGEGLPSDIQGLQDMGVIDYNYNALRDGDDVSRLIGIQDTQDMGVIDYNYNALQDGDDVSRLIGTQDTQDMGVIDYNYNALRDGDDVSRLIGTQDTQDMGVIDYNYNALRDGDDVSRLIGIQDTQDMGAIDYNYNALRDGDDVSRLIGIQGLQGIDAYHFDSLRNINLSLENIASIPKAVLVGCSDTA